MLYNYNNLSTVIYISYIKKIERSINLYTFLKLFKISRVWFSKKVLNILMKIYFIKVILKQKYLLYKNKYVLFHLIIYLSSHLNSKECKKMFNRKKKLSRFIYLLLVLYAKLLQNQIFWIYYQKEKKKGTKIAIL